MKRFRQFGNGHINYWEIWESDGRIHGVGDVYRGGRRETSSRTWCSMEDFKVWCSQENVVKE